MAYEPLHHKYRPQRFDQLVGQEAIAATLSQALQRGRIAPAYLFSGPRGTGKTSSARILARSLNCLSSEGPTAEPCGHCELCTAIAAGGALDVIEIDAASNTGVDNIRELRDGVSYTPTSGTYKIYLIDEVHMLSKAAFNALLKTLEEPPPHVIFLFATTEPNKILDTILSRVQRFDFKRIPVNAVVKRLREISQSEGATLSDGALAMIARSGEGSMRDAQSLLDKVISFGGSAEISDEQVADTLGLIDRGLLYEMIGGLTAGEPERCLGVIAEVYEYGYELSQFTAEMLEMLRHATLVQLSPGSRKFVDLPEEEMSRLSGLVADVPAEVLTRHFQVMLDLHDQVARANRPRIVLEIGIVRAATRRPVQPIGALVDRLEQLDRNMRRAGGSASRTAPPQRRAPPAAAPSRRAPDSRQPARRGAPRPSRSEPRRSATPPESPPDPEPGPAVVASPPAQPEPSSRPQAPPPEPPIADISRPQAEQIPVPQPPEHTPWELLQKDLVRFGGPAARLARGEPSLVEDVLTITLPGGRSLADGRRALRRDDVRAAIDRHFGPNVATEVSPAAGTSPDAPSVLEKQALDDPGIQRVMRALGATLESVVELTNKDGDSDGL